MLKHNMLRIVLFGILLFSALVYSMSTFPNVSAASNSFNLQAGLVSASIVQRPPRTFFAIGFRDGYRNGYRDGRQDCPRRGFGGAYGRRHRQFSPGEYNNGFQAGYPRGYQVGINSCHRWTQAENIRHL